ETEAIRRRVDLKIARIEVDTLAKTYGLTNATRFINLLDVAGISRTQRETGGAAGTGGGFQGDFQVPVFDFGAVGGRPAGEIYLAAINRLSELAVNARSEARDRYRAYRSLAVPGSIAYELIMKTKSRSTRRKCSSRGCTINMPIMPMPICTISSECGWYMKVPLALIANS